MDLMKLFGFDKIKHLLLTRVMPDSLYLKLMFRKKMGKPLNLKEPHTLNEKMQWSKLYDKNPLYQIVADKYRVREYVTSIIGESYLIPMLQVFDRCEDISLENLPNPPYIIKNNHDNSGGIIVRVGDEFDLNEVRNRLSLNMKKNHYWLGKEWQYKNIPRKIIVERLLLDSEDKIPNDYKFNCFNGRVEFVYVSIDREGMNYRKIYNRDWSPLPMTWTYRGNENKKFFGPDIDKPKNYEEMILVAEKLASAFKYVRIDLYNVDGAIFFGEITLHHGSGFEPILPEKYDLFYGSLISHDRN